MFDIWKNIGGIVSVNHSKVTISNFVFQLHYKATAIILVVFSLMVTSRQYIGDPINCVSNEEIKKIADDYCWIHSTFTRGTGPLGKGPYAPETEISPGIRPAVEGDKLVYTSYYQWVWCILFIQAAFFYLPHLIWKMFEHGRLRSLVSDLNLVIVDDEEKQKYRDSIVKYFSYNRGYHNLYVFAYLMCELLNFVNIVSQIFFTDAFVNHGFTDYGMKIFEYNSPKPGHRSDSLASVFPTVTSCKISTGGLAYNVVDEDVLCVLPINILNEKIYIFLWFWFLFVATLTSLGLIYRLITLIPRVRFHLIKIKIRFIDENSLEEYIYDCNYGDWFLIYKLGQNMDSYTYSLLLKELSRNEFTKNHIRAEQPCLRSES